MLGPAGVSNSNDPKRPPKTEITPKADANIAICSGPFEKALAVAAGIKSSAVINKTPTIFIDIAITLAINTIKIAFARSGLNPQQEQPRNSQLTQKGRAICKKEPKAQRNRQTKLFQFPKPWLTKYRQTKIPSDLLGPTS